MATTSELYPNTIGAALEWAVRRLNDQGCTESAGDALKLWSSLGGDPLGPYVDKDAAVDDSFWRRYHAAVLSRAEGIPLAYAAGVAGFRKLDLVVDARVLIPRPETEGLVQLVLDWAMASDCAGWAADVGTGSGCIALSLAVEGPFAGVLGIDISEAALEVARCNLDAVRPATPVEFRHGDGLEPLRDESIDLVISNPPYLTVSEYETLAGGVREHEPREADSQQPFHAVPPGAGVAVPILPRPGRLHARWIAALISSRSCARPSRPCTWR